MIASNSADQCYFLRRNETQANLFLNSFKQLFDEKSLFDCSIVCEGKVIKAHKVILAAASEYFKTAFISFNNPCQNTALLIRDVPFHDLKLIINFIYKGEAKIEKKFFSSFQKSVQSLKVTWLDTSFSITSLESKSAKGSNHSSMPHSLQSLNSVQSLDGQTLPNSSFPRPNVIYPSNYRNSNPHSSNFTRVISSPSPSSKFIYQPHEPFVQLRELLRRDNCVKKSSNVTNQLGSVDDQSNDKKEYSIKDFDKIAIQKTDSHHENHHGFQVENQKVQKEEVEQKLEQEVEQEQEVKVEVELEGIKKGEQEEDTNCNDDDGNDDANANADADADADVDADDVADDANADADADDDDDADADADADGDADTAAAADADANDDDDDDDDNDDDDDGDDDDDDDDDDVDVDDDEQIEAAGLKENGFDLTSHQSEQVIDMSVNSLHLEKYSSKENEEINNEKDSYLNHASPESNLNKIDEKNYSSHSTSKSYSILPLSVNIPSSFSYATARAIAASTTLAIASGLLSNSHHSSLEENVNSCSKHLTENQDNDSISSQIIPLKRGRGRPPRHLRDGQDDLKNLKVISSSGTLSPNTLSTSSTASSLKVSNSNELTPPKKRRISLETLINIKDHKPKMSSFAIDIHGKNVCPYCPQVYYSNQAMNDHINNVHTGNAHKYTCSMCSKEFSWKISLTKHLRNSHKQEKMDLEEKGILIL